MSARSSTVVNDEDRPDMYHDASRTTTFLSDLKQSKKLRSACIKFSIATLAFAGFVAMLLWFVARENGLVSPVIVFSCFGFVLWIVRVDKFVKDIKRYRREKSSRERRVPVPDEENAIPLQPLNPVRTPERVYLEDEKLDYLS
ncbi:hypothetical protein M434DRAFT_382510 [Hypoxylon sp. CO27-5]|nr:hypothetical protein M434DRAFT_382510 [Hypoxylon sp. CO27-5]